MESQNKVGDFPLDFPGGAKAPPTFRIVETKIQKKMENQEQKPKKEGRGGYRPGAGRKPTGCAPSSTVAFRLDPEEKEEMQAFLQSHGLTVRKFVRQALDALYEKEGQ